MLTTATEAQFTEFLDNYGYAVASDSGPLLALAFTFVKSLPFCDAEQADTPEILEAQCFIAYAMSSEGGGFDPSRQLDARVVTKTKLEGLERQFEVNEAVGTGTDSYSLLKSIPMAFSLLQTLLCEIPTGSSTTHAAGVFVV